MEAEQLTWPSIRRSTLSRVVLVHVPRQRVPQLSADVRLPEQALRLSRTTDQNALVVLAMCIGACMAGAEMSASDDCNVVLTGGEPFRLEPLREVAGTGEAYRIVWNDHMGTTWWAYTVELSEGREKLTLRDGNTRQSRSMALGADATKRIRSVIEANGFWKGRSVSPPNDGSFRAMMIQLTVEGCRRRDCSCFTGLEATDLVAYPPLIDELGSLLELTR